MAYQVIAGQEGVSFPFPDNHIILSETTSQKDLKTVFEHPLGPGFVELVFEPQTLVVESAPEVAEPLDVAFDPATEPVAVAEPKTAKKGAKS